ncbi:hypothetical protein [Streptomyces sp. NPDC012825]|uniref:hypothetical protein n=1 Tax=Streptomyces sp. NPDC012825 TaxID=3364851 RepID=UPI00367A3345
MITAQPHSRAARSRLVADLWRLLGTAALFFGLLVAHGAGAEAHAGCTVPARVTASQTGGTSDEHAPVRPGHDCSPMPAQASAAPPASVTRSTPVLRA